MPYGGQCSFWNIQRNFVLTLKDYASWCSVYVQCSYEVNWGACFQTIQLYLILNLKFGNIQYIVSLIPVQKVSTFKVDPIQRNLKQITEKQIVRSYLKSN